MNRNEILMANGWLHEAPAELPAHRSAAQKPKTRFFRRVAETALHTIRMVHAAFDRKLLSVEHRLCEQLA